MINFIFIVSLLLGSASFVEARLIYPKTIAQFVQQHPQTKWMKCTQNYAFEYPLFPLYPEHSQKYFPNKGLHSDISIIEVPGGIAYSDGSGCIFINDTFIKEMQIKTLEPFQGAPCIERADLGHVHKVSGRVAVVTHLYPYNYGLFVLEILSTLALLEINNVDYDYLWIPYGCGWIQELLDIWGIDRSKVIPLYIDQAIQADSIILPTSISQNDVMVFNVNYHPDFLLKYAKEKMLRGMKNRQVDIELPKKIFISRKDARRFAANEDEIFALFEPLGYRRYELVHLTPTQKIALFFNAEKIVSFMGSGSANIVFAGPNAHYFEIMHEFVEASYCYISSTLGLQYSYIDASTYENLVHGQVWSDGRAIPLSLFKNYIQEHYLEL